MRRILAVGFLGLAGLPAQGAEQPANYISIGNSFSLFTSYGKSAIGQVAALAELAGRAKPGYGTNVFLSNRGGSKLYDHLNGVTNDPPLNPYYWNDGGTNRGIVWDSLPPGQTWDFVIVQGFSDVYYDVPGYSTNEFPTNAVRLYQHTANHSADVTPVFYETWAYNTNGFPTMDQPARRLELYTAYQKALALATNSGATRARVAHVGEAFALLNWEDNLYSSSDWYHPSREWGTLLIGLTLYMTAYNDDLSDLPLDAAVSNLINNLDLNYDLTGSDWTQLVAVAESVTWPDGHIVISTNTLRLVEGSNCAFQARLSRNPSGEVQVVVQRYRGPTNVLVTAGSSLSFNDTNWNQWQTVTVSVASDGAPTADSARLELLSSSMGSRDLWADIQDDGAGDTNVFLMTTNRLRVDFGLTNAPVDVAGGWTAFALPSSTTATSTGIIFAVGEKQVSVNLSAGNVLSGRDRGNPAADAGDLTIAKTYRDLVHTSSGHILITVTGLYAHAEVTVRTWVYDWQFADSNTFFMADVTDGRSNTLGQITNLTGNAALPTNDLMYSISGSFQADGTGRILLHVAGTATARLNGLDLTETGLRNMNAVVFTNGTPAPWLARHGLPLSDAGALDDTDDDGMAAWEEFIADTSPTNAASVLRLVENAAQSNGSIISWIPATQRWYSVYFATNLLDPEAWTFLTATNGGSVTNSLHTTTTSIYYRLGVQHAP